MSRATDSASTRDTRTALVETSDTAVAVAIAAIYGLPAAAGLLARWGLLAPTVACCAAFIGVAVAVVELCLWRWGGGEQR